MDLGNLVDAYTQFMQAHPHLGNILTAEVVYTIGDVASQLIGRKPINWRQVRYTAASAPIYGLGIEALMETGNIAGELIHDDPLTKAAAGPNLWGNLYNAWFFAHRSIGQKNEWSIWKSAKEYYQRTRDFLTLNGNSYWSETKDTLAELVPEKEYLIAVAATLTAWNGVQCFNYSMVPEHLQTPFVLGASLVWSVAISALSLAGMKKGKYVTSK